MRCCSGGLMIVIMVLACEAELWALGTESFGNQPVTAQPEWLPGTLEAINLKSRVYSRWINGNESFFFRGTIKDLNEALAKYAGIKGDPAMPLEVFVLPSAGSTQTFKGTPVACDWELRVPSGLYLARSRAASTPEMLPVQPSLAIFAGSKSFDFTQLKLPGAVKLVGPDQLVARGLKGLKSTNDDVVVDALDSLSSHAWALESLDPIVQCLSSRREYVRVCAANAVARIGPRAKAATELLRKAATDASERYKPSFEQAIEALEGKESPATRSDVELRERVRKLLKENSKLESPAASAPGRAPGVARQ